MPRIVSEVRVPRLQWDQLRSRSLPDFDGVKRLLGRAERAVIQYIAELPDNDASATKTFVQSALRQLAKAQEVPSATTTPNRYGSWESSLLKS